MNRRKFLGFLAAAPLVAKAAPLLKLIPEAPVQATIAEYTDFVTMSQFIVQTAIDPMVAECALERGRRAALTFDTLYMQQYA